MAIDQDNAFAVPDANTQAWASKTVESDVLWRRDEKFQQRRTHQKFLIFLPGLLDGI